MCRHDLECVGYVQCQGRWGVRETAFPSEPAIYRSSLSFYPSHTFSSTKVAKFGSSPDPTIAMSSPVVVKQSAKAKGSNLKKLTWYRPDFTATDVDKYLVSARPT